jgi:hypothetical protein
MSLISVVQDVCVLVGVERPSAIFAAITTDRTAQEMLATANEMVAQTAFDYRDWTALIKTATIPGDGVTTSFPLPSDFRRLLIDGNIWSSIAPQTPLVFISSFDEWIYREAGNYWIYAGQYIIQGNNILIQPPLPPTATVKFAYVCNNIVNNNNAVPRGVSDRFMSDEDTTVLDERLLKLGMIWKWKYDKGAPYAEDMGTYTDALMMRAGKDQPAPIMVNRVPLMNSVRATVAYPWPLPTP